VTRNGQIHDRRVLPLSAALYSSHTTHDKKQADRPSSSINADSDMPTESSSVSLHPHHGRILLRDPSTLFPTPLPAHYSFLSSAPGSRRRINIRHPGYEPEDDLLLTLYALDHEDGGIHHVLLHTTCAIISGNRCDGYLSESCDGTPITAGMDDVLRAGEYYFHVPRIGGVVNFD